MQFGGNKGDEFEIIKRNETEKFNKPSLPTH